MLLNTQEDEMLSDCESVEPVSEQMLSESVMNGNAEKPLSVLDELDRFW